MEDLKQALILRRKYNQMPFNEFVKLVEEYIDNEFPREVKEDFQFCGLNNVDFFTMNVDL